MEEREVRVKGGEKGGADREGNEETSCPTVKNGRFTPTNLRAQLAQKVLERLHADQCLHLSLHSVPLGEERRQPRCLEAKVSSAEYEWRA